MSPLSRSIKLLLGCGIFLLLPLALLAAWLHAADTEAKSGTAANTSPSSTSKSKEPNYIRVTRDVHGNPLALETSIVRLVPQGSEHPGLAVDLISAVHVADKGYYEELNKRFADYDVVLYELVAPEGTVVPKGGLDRNRNALSAVQNGMKDLLELEYQLTGVDYTTKNFVHADLSPDEFSKSMKAKGESFWTIFFRLMAAGMVQQASNPEKANELDLLMAVFDHDRALKLKAHYGRPVFRHGSDRDGVQRPRWLDAHYRA